MNYAEYQAEVLGIHGAEARKRKNEEFKLHKDVVTYLKWTVPATCAWTHFPAGGKRSKKVAGELSAMGLKPGWPDLQFLWFGRFYGVELKAEGGTLSAVQRQAHEKIRGAGGVVAVCDSLDMVMATLRSWGIPLNDRTP